VSPAVSAEQVSYAAAGGLDSAGMHNTWCPWMDVASSSAFQDTSRPLSALTAPIPVGVVGPDPPRLMTSEGSLLSRDPSWRTMAHTRVDVASAVQLVPLKNDDVEMVSLVDVLLDDSVKVVPIVVQPLADELSQSLPTITLASMLLVPAFVTPDDVKANAATTLVGQAQRAAEKYDVNASSLRVVVVPELSTRASVNAKSVVDRAVAAATRAGESSIIVAAQPVI
jgi:hypothetical protein